MNSILNKLYSSNPNTLLIYGIILISIGTVLLITFVVRQIKSRKINQSNESSEDILNNVIDEEVKNSKIAITEEPKVAFEEPKEDTETDDVNEESSEEVIIEEPEVAFEESKEDTETDDVNEEPSEEVIIEEPEMTFEEPKEDDEANDINEEPSEKVTTEEPEADDIKEEIPQENTIVETNQSETANINVKKKKKKKKKKKNTNNVGMTNNSIIEPTSISDEIIKKDLTIEPLESVSPEIVVPIKSDDKKIFIDSEIDKKNDELNKMTESSTEDNDVNDESIEVL